MSHLKKELAVARLRYRLAVRAMHANNDPNQHTAYAQKMYDASREVKRIEAIERAEKKVKA